MSAQLVPINNSPNQQLAVSLNVDGGVLQLNLTLRYNSQTPASSAATDPGFWLMDIADKSGDPLIYGVPLLAGVYPAGNILQPYGYLAIGSAYVINASGGSGDWPDDQGLGAQWYLLWDDTAN